MIALVSSENTESWAKTTSSLAQKKQMKLPCMLKMSATSVFTVDI